MMCPVCKRDLAPTLSICLTCGAMINDTVREELETKISKGEAAVSTSGRLGLPKRAPVQAAPPEMPTPPPVKSEIQAAPVKKELPETAVKEVPTAPPAAQPKPIGARFDTNDLRVKKTSPTLVEFQTKKATVPEWRLQLQNSVRQKVGTNKRDNATEAPASKPRTTNGANALKVEFVEDEQPRHQNPKVASALKRIEASRKTFSNQPIAEQSVKIGKPATPRNFPFDVVTPSEPARRQPPRASVNPSPKPMLVSPLKIEKRGFDTNKLPPLKEHAEPQRTFIPAATEKPRSTDARVAEKAIGNEIVEIETVETDEIEDLAPLSMRFGSGVFDMIVGLFATLILLSPFMLAGGTWLSLSGAFAFTAALAIVMFLYLTISLAFQGRTIGMRLFSLELVDVEENAYPTLHQAAVNSAVYLLSLIFAGVGFIPVFFNEERRAAHDILSGTILVREY